MHYTPVLHDVFALSCFILCTSLSDVHRSVTGLKGWQLGFRTAESSGVIPRFLPWPLPLLPGLHAARLPGQRCRHHQRRPVIWRPRRRHQRDMRRLEKVCVLGLGWISICLRCDSTVETGPGLCPAPWTDKFCFYVRFFFFLSFLHLLLIWLMTTLKNKNNQYEREQNVE